MKEVIQNIKINQIEPLRQQEIDLIYLLRYGYPFGSVEILMRDGIPFDVVKTVKRVRLGELSIDDIDGI